MRASAVVFAIVSAVLSLPSSHAFNTISGLLHPIAAEKRKLRPRTPAVDPISPKPLKLEVGPSLTEISRARNLLRQLERQWHSETEVTPFEAPVPADGQPEVCGTWDWIPPAMGQLDISETDTEWRVAVDLPGLSKDHILIEVDRGMLRIQAHGAYEPEQEGVTYTLQERTHGAVCRVLQLPDTVSAKKSTVTAKYEHGVLYITLEKRQPRASTTRESAGVHCLRLAAKQATLVIASFYVDGMCGISFGPLRASYKCPNSAKFNKQHDASRCCMLFWRCNKHHCALADRNTAHHYTVQHVRLNQLTTRPLPLYTLLVFPAVITGAAERDIAPLATPTAASLHVHVTLAQSWFRQQHASTLQRL
eukprot:15710-Heterococcus_DN1.PRE.1